MKRIALLVVILAASFAQGQSGVKFVSVNHNIYTFQKGHVLIHAKCEGNRAGVSFNAGNCNLGDYLPGSVIPEYGQTADRSKRCLNLLHSSSTADATLYISSCPDIVSPIFIDVNSDNVSVDFCGMEHGHCAILFPHMVEFSVVSMKETK